MERAFLILLTFLNTMFFMKAQRRKTPTHLTSPANPETASTECLISLTERANNEINHIRTAYTWISGLLSLIIITGVSIFYFLYSASVKDLKTQMSDQVRLTQELAIQESKMAWSDRSNELNDRFQNLTKSLEQRVDKAFEIDQIQQLVSKRVSAITDEYISAKASEILEPKVQELSNETKLQLSTIEKVAPEKLPKIDQTTNFYKDIFSSLRDDRRSFERLKKLASSPESPFSKQASSAVDVIKEDFDSIGYAESGLFGPPLVPWAEGIKPDDVPFDDLTKAFIETKEQWTKLALMYFIWGEARFSKHERLKFLIETISASDDLAITANAASIVNREEKLAFHPLDTASFLAWWSKNETRFK